MELEIDNNICKNVDSTNSINLEYPSTTVNVEKRPFISKLSPQAAYKRKQRSRERTKTRISLLKAFPDWLQHKKDWAETAGCKVTDEEFAIHLLQLHKTCFICKQKIEKWNPIVEKSTKKSKRKPKQSKVAPELVADLPAMKFNECNPDQLSLDKSEINKPQDNTIPIILLMNDSSTISTPPKTISVDNTVNQVEATILESSTNLNLNNKTDLVIENQSIMAFNIIERAPVLINSSNDNAFFIAEPSTPIKNDHNANVNNIDLMSIQNNPSVLTSSPIKRHLRSQTIIKPKSIEINDHIDNEDQGGPFLCDICDISLIDAYTWKIHRKSHHVKQAYKCEECGKSYAMKENYLGHMNWHRNEKPFVCETCGKAFYNRSALSEHRKSHSGEKYQCEICEKFVSSKSGLASHLATHSSERPFLCDLCGMSFRQKCILNHHMNTHTNARPFACDECPKAFGTPAALRKHKISHTNEKRYECEECGKRFTNRHHIKRHRLIHTQSKPFICETCGKAFNQKSNLKVHVRSHLRRQNQKTNNNNNGGKKASEVEEYEEEYDEEYAYVEELHVYQ